MARDYDAILGSGRLKIGWLTQEDPSESCFSGGSGSGAGNSITMDLWRAYEGVG